MKFYRYEYSEYAGGDEDYGFNAPKIPNPKLELRTYELIKETEKGFWIGYKDISYKKWVSKTSKKRYAYPTKAEAMENFIIRTKYRIKFLQWEIDCCKIVLNLANNPDLIK